MLTPITALWAPILLATVVAWIASAVVHMVIKWHNADYSALPNEDEVSDALRKGGAGPAFYNLPYCADMKDMGSEAMQAKFNRGPVAMIAIMPSGMPPMGKLLGQQIAHFLVGSFLIAYVATLAFAPGADYLEVFRFIASVGFLTYGFANIPFSIWYGHPWGTTFRFLLDALIYGLLTAGVFAWLWPAA